MNKEKVYGVEQSCHGHCYRWIFDEKTLLRNGIDCSEINKTTQDILFPIGGSNSGATYFVELNTEEEIKDFLLSEYYTDLDDPMLVDIAEGIVTIDTDYDSITGQYIEKFFITEEQLTRDNGYLKPAQEMIARVKAMNLDCDIDFDNPFYGASKSMRYSALCEICENIGKAVLKITYSWGDEEPIIDCETREAAWEKAKIMAMHEAEVAGEEYDCDLP